MGLFGSGSAPESYGGSSREGTELTREIGDILGGSWAAGGNVYGQNPRTGAIELWGTPSLLGGVQTTALGYQAGRGLGNVGTYNLGAAGLQAASHAGRNAYHQAHRNIRQQAILGGFQKADQVQQQLDDYLSTHINLGTMSIDDAEKIQADIAAGNYSSLPGHVKSNVDITGLEEAVMGTGRYDTGINDPLAVGLSKLGVLDLQTPQSFYERQRQKKTARGDVFDVAKSYAMPAALRGAGYAVAGEFSDPMVSGLTAGLSAIPAALSYSPGAAAGRIADLTELANIHEIEVALGLTPARDWSDLPETIGDSDSIYNATDTLKYFDSTPTESAEDRAMRWNILQARKEALKDSEGLNFMV